MLLRKHPTAVCDLCNEPLWYGVKEEPTGWKVYYHCNSEDGCGKEWSVGRIARSDVENLDEVYSRAERRIP
jgi:hypothetical protein